MKNNPWIHQPLIEKTKHFVETIMKEDTSGHDYLHVMRVYETAVKLAKHTRANRLDRRTREFASRRRRSQIGRQRRSIKIASPSFLTKRRRRRSVDPPRD
ncbi:MAG: hypothetical protein MZU97_05840 [Bacillus subtilis]|nr:hypothetical protein [Bacillus subtilis]